MIETEMQESPRLTWGERDCWPFVRILIVAFILGAAAHHFTGWTIDARHLLGLPRQMLGVLAVLAMISFALAEIYLLLFAIPIYAVGVLNDWFYWASRWVCRTAFGIRSAFLLALFGVCGEIALFGLSFYLLKAHMLSCL